MSIIIYADGGSRANGTEWADCYGSYAYEVRNGWEIHRCEFSNSRTNNEAEYEAAINALEVAKSEGWKNVTLRMDSALVINQAGGKWKIREPRLRPLCERLKELLQETSASLEWVSRDKVVEILGH